MTTEKMQKGIRELERLILSTEMTRGARTRLLNKVRQVSLEAKRVNRKMNKANL